MLAVIVLTMLSENVNINSAIHDHVRQEVFQIRHLA
jgi:hypothetical protein